MTVSSPAKVYPFLAGLRIIGTNDTGRMLLRLVWPVSSLRHKLCTWVSMCFEHDP